MTNTATARSWTLRRLTLIASAVVAIAVAVGVIAYRSDDAKASVNRAASSYMVPPSATHVMRRDAGFGNDRATISFVLDYGRGVSRPGVTRCDVEHFAVEEAWSGFTASSAASDDGKRCLNSGTIAAHTVGIEVSDGDDGTVRVAISVSH